MTSRKINVSAQNSRLLDLGPMKKNFSYLSRLARMVSTQSGGEFFTEFQFASGQMTMLSVIGTNEDITQNELASAMLMKKSQVTNLIADLVSRGLVSREAHGSDRRFNTLRLTPAGQKIWKRVKVQVAKHSEQLLQPLNPKEQETLNALLCKLLGAHLKDSGIDFS